MYGLKMMMFEGNIKTNNLKKCNLKITLLSRKQIITYSRFSESL